METVSINELKNNLALWTEKASQGFFVEITRYHQPYALLCPPKSFGVLRGSKFGTATLRPISKNILEPKVLQQTLSDDRSSRE